MKKIRNLLLVAILSFVVFTANTFAKEKVKIYIFEAGGCPYCEEEIKYLKGLKSYGEKFEIVQKELYVDHVDWEEGKDYELGVKVAEAFQNKGYTQASYQGTPFVVISNIYAAASYNDQLESVINEAYEAGDKDIAGCFEDDKDGCADKIKESEEEPTTDDSTTDPTQTLDNKKESSDNNSVTAAIVLILIVGACAAVIVVIRGKNRMNEEEIKEEPVKKAEEKPEPKKTTTVKKATTTKATTAKKTTATKKTTAKKATTKKATTAKKTTKK